MVYRPIRKPYALPRKSESQGEKKPALASQWLSQVPNIIAGTTGLCFVVSSIYDYGFFTALGLEFNDVPVTITDRVQTAFEWLPGAGAIVLLLWGLWYLNEIKPLRSKSDPGYMKFKYIFSKTEDILVFIMAIIFLADNIKNWYLYNRINILFIFISLSIFMAFTLFYSKRKISIALILCSYLLFVLILIGVKGYCEADSQIHGTSLHHLEMQRATENVVECRILRSFESVALVWMPEEREVCIVPWKDIKQIRFPYEPGLFTSEQFPSSQTLESELQNTTISNDTIAPVNTASDTVDSTMNQP